MLLDFAALVLAPTPNQYLLCPAEHCRAAQEIHAHPPVFDVPADRLEAALLEVLRALPRLSETAADPPTRRYAFEQRSAVFGFVDAIDIEILDLGAAKASLAVYSRSRVGYSDLGVNRRRVEALLAALKERVGTVPR